MTDREAVRSRGSTLFGILAMLAGGACFAVMDALVKWESPRVSVMQIIFFRSLFAFLPILVQVAREGGRAALKTRRLRDHAGRSLFGFGSLVCFVYAFGRMPLADVVAIGFSAPIFITALSVPLLGESVGIRRWSAVLVGFIGVLVMVRPGSGVFGATASLALGATLLYALAMIYIRRLGRTESTGAIAFYYTAICALMSAAALPFAWTVPGAVDGFLLAAIGIIGGCGQLCVTAAFRNGPAAVVAPFDYASMLYVVLIGYAIWGDIPDRILLLGVAIVVASGLYILRRETRRAVLGRERTAE
ncbi:MAG: DMT family transporter [Alphaproteobacteria bacterium]|nr:DMT family transporter [Alphaproteobacteria bacterium]